MYCDTIPYELAVKLKEKGMPMEEGGKSIIDWKVPTYAEVFDWLMEQGYRIIILTKPAVNPTKWFAYIGTMPPDHIIVGNTQDCDTWHEAANAAIEKALEL